MKELRYFVHCLQLLNTVKCTHSKLNSLPDIYYSPNPLSEKPSINFSIQRLL